MGEIVRLASGDGVIGPTAVITSYLISI